MDAILLLPTENRTKKCPKNDRSKTGRFGIRWVTVYVFIQKATCTHSGLFKIWVELSKLNCEVKYKPTLKKYQ